MFLGHGMLAFALAAGLAALTGWSRERALAVGLVAGAFALAPDVDILYAPIGMVGAATLTGAVEGFWSTGNLIHRAVTHSLVVAPFAALAVGLYRHGRDTGGRGALLGSVGLFGLVAAAAGVTSGYLGVVVVVALAVACLAVATAGGRLGLGPKAVGGAALLGLVSHPFGDLFTGEPPAFLYPFETVLVAERIALSADPTLHLLGAMGFELATFWFAVVVFLALRGERLREHLDGRAALGLGYAAAAFVIPAPTLEVSYQFVFGVLGLGMVSATPLPRRLSRTRLALPGPAGSLARHVRLPRPQFSFDPLEAAVTGLAAASLAAVAYGAVYVGLFL